MKQRRSRAAAERSSRSNNAIGAYHWPWIGEIKMPLVKETPKIGRGKAGPGRPKGLPNKTTALLKDALLIAATRAGGKGGLEAFLLKQAKKANNAPFMTLLGKVLPTQLADGDGEVPSIVIFKTTYEDDAAGIPPTPYIPRTY
jgi:hypothetical protein